MSQAMFNMDGPEQDLFAMSIPLNNNNNNSSTSTSSTSSTTTPSNQDKNIPDVLLSPILYKSCKDEINELNLNLNQNQNNNNSNNEWLFSLDDTLTSPSPNDNCQPIYYNMAQQNYQLWLSSF